MRSIVINAVERFAELAGAAIELAKDELKNRRRFQRQELWISTYMTLHGAEGRSTAYFSEDTALTADNIVDAGYDYAQNGVRPRK